MPINKNAFIRYKILDKCFSDKYHKYFIEDLMEKVNTQLIDAGIKSISKKQIYDGKHPTPILAVWTISATFAPC